MSHGRHTARSAFDAGGGRWTPANEADLVVWFDARHGVTTSSGSVTSWADKTGNLTLSQGVTVAQPDYDATGWDGSLPGIRFGKHGGSNAYTDLRNQSSPSVNSYLDNCTVCMTIKTTSVGVGAYQFLLCSYLTTDNVRLAWGWNDGPVELLDLHAGGAPIYGSAISANSKLRMMLKRTNASDGELTTIDGVTSINTTDGAAVTSANAFALGGQAFLGISRFEGWIADVAIFGSPKDLVSKWQAYSTREWG